MEKNAACGPPYPIGTPNRCEFPTAASAPISPGDFNRVSANKSVAIQTNDLFSCAKLHKEKKSWIDPSVSGY